MDKKKFLELANKTRMSKRNKQIAYQVLVKNRKPKSIAKQVNLSRQSIEYSVKTILNIEKRRKKVPNSWKNLNITVSPALAVIILYLEKSERKDKNLIVKNNMLKPILSEYQINLLKQLF